MRSYPYLRSLTISRLCFLLFIAALFIQHPATAQVKRTVKETLLSRTGFHEFANNTYTLSNDLRRIAFRIKKEGKLIAVIDTIHGKPYDDVMQPVFSNDGKRFAYSAKNGSNWQIVADHKEEVKLDSGVTVSYLRFSPDGKKLLYTINDGKHIYIVYHGIKSKPYDVINENSIAFSSLDKIAYTVTLNGKQFNVFDGKEGEAFEQVGFPILNPDGKQFVYWASNGRNYYVVANNVKSKPYEAVGSMKYSPNGLHLLYDVQQGRKYLVIYDGKESEKYDEVHSYLLSPDGARLAYAMVQPHGDEEFNAYVVIDGKTEGPYEQVLVESIQFSPDGNEVIYGAQLPMHEMKNGVKTEIEAYEWFVVRHGKEQTRYNMLQGSMVFSPNSQHLAYGAEKYIKRMVNLDGKEEPPYDDIYHMVFSPDSKYLAYTAKLGSKEFVVLDGTNGKAYDELPGQKEIIFDSPNTFHYLARKGDNIYLVEEIID